MRCIKEFGIVIACVRLICLGIIKLGMPVCMGVNPTLSYGHSILMINLLIFIAVPNAVSNISWGWMWFMFLAAN
jgi:hypothetical protein